VTHIHWVTRGTGTPKDWKNQTNFVVYYESIKRKVKTKYICGCRCYERLQPNTKEFTRLTYTELVLELEHLKIETRLNYFMFIMNQ
jgi:hypothetical protein